MGRIPEEEIERLKREIPLERLVSGFGVELQRHGANLMGRCPFHEDRTPSLSVTPSTNRWHCLGACNVGGTTIDWVMKTRGVSFRHAVELLRADHPSLAAGDGRVVRKGTTVKLAAPVAPDAGDQELARRGGVLQRHAEGIAGIAGVSPIAWAHASGDDRPLQAGLCEP
jgi:hypothetical protein